MSTENPSKVQLPAQVEGVKQLGERLGLDFWSYPGAGRPLHIHLLPNQVGAFLFLNFFSPGC